MFPGMNPREMQKAMRRLGISDQQIPAELVIIKTQDKDIVFKKPSITKISMMGQESFQIVGEFTEVYKDKKISDGAIEISEEDIKTVMTQTNCTNEEAIKTLEKTNGDLAEAILTLQNDKS